MDNKTSITHRHPGHLQYRCLICEERGEAPAMVQYKIGERRGFAHHKCLPLDLAIALADTEAVYASLEDLQRRSCERCQTRLEEAKRPLVAIAKYVGYSEAMKWRKRPLPEIETALRRMQRKNAPPGGWPYGEYWVLGEAFTDQEPGLQNDAEEEA